MNSVNLTGRLTRDPEAKTSATGNMVARYTLAVKREVKDETDFIPVVAFGKAAEFAQKYFHKGMMVGVQGKIRISSYDKDGEKRYSTDIYVDRQEFLEKKQEAQPNTTPAQDWFEGGLPF